VALSVALSVALELLSPLQPVAHELARSRASAVGVDLSVSDMGSR